MTTAAIYIRKSRKDKDNVSHRLQVQREQLPAYARSQRWEIAIYDDGHASAARGKTEDLKERGRLEADIRAGKINIILTIELSRLSRDDSMQDYVAWLHLCSEHGVKLATLSRILDPAQHSDWMLLLMEGGFSSVEMRVMRTRMKEGYDQAVRAGKYLGGRPPAPYIYDHAAGRPVIDQEQLPRMQKLWKLAETASAAKIADRLGMPEITVRRSISDDRLQFCLAQRSDPETGDIITCDWEPCITSEQADLIRAGRRHRRPGDNKAAYASLLSNLGMLYCGHCGSTAKTWQNSKIKADGTRVDYYGCTNRTKCKSRMFQQQIINQHVVNSLCAAVADIAHLQIYWDQAQDEAVKGDELTDIIKQLQADEARKARLVGAIAEGILNFADARRQLDTINNRINTLNGRRQQLVHIDDSPDWNLLHIDREEFNALDMEDQRDLLRLAIKKVALYRDSLEVTFSFPISPDGSSTSTTSLS